MHRALFLLPINSSSFCNLINQKINQSRFSHAIFLGQFFQLSISFNRYRQSNFFLFNFNHQKTFFLTIFISIPSLYYTYVRNTTFFIKSQNLPKTPSLKGFLKKMFCLMDNGHMGGVVVPPCFSLKFYPTQTKIWAPPTPASCVSLTP